MIEHDADLKSALRQLPAPEPGPDLLSRILRSRSMGRRITDPTREATTSWRWIAAAAAVAVLITGSWVVTLSLSKMGESGAARDQLDELLRETMPWPSPDDPQEVRREIPPPAYALIETADLDTSRLTAGVWTYRSEMTTDGVLTEHSGGSRIRLVAATYDGRPAWMVNTARRSRSEGWGQYMDTTYLDPRSLRPLQAFATVNKGRTRVEQSFSADSGHQSTSTTRRVKTSWRADVAFPFAPAVLFINDLSTERLTPLVQAFSLERGWRGSLYQVSLFYRVQIATPLDLRVVGTDRVTVPAGTFDCWRLEVVSHVWAAERSRMWVSRDRGWLIKEQHHGSDYVINRMLESYEHLE